MRARRNSWRRRWTLVPLASGALLVVLAVALVVGAWPFSHASARCRWAPALAAGPKRSASDVRSPASCRPSPAARRIEHALQARRAQLDTPAATARRVASRLAFRNLSPTSSESLVRRDFAAVLRGTNPARTVAQSGRVVRYLGDSRALVRTAAGATELIRSTVPLVSSVGHGRKRAVDLTLRRSGSAYIAANPLEHVAIGAHVSEGVRVGPDGLRLTPLGAPALGSVLGDAVYFHDLGTDEDATVTPTVRGVELSTLLRSRLSPEQIVYRVALPAHAALVQSDAGTIVKRAGHVLANIQTPNAVDAQSTPVPVSMRVSGDELVLSVAHRARDVAYPILIDPRVTFPVGHTSPGWTFFSCKTECPSDEHWGSEIEGPEPGVLRAPASYYSYGIFPEGLELGPQKCEEDKAEDPAVAYCELFDSEPLLRPAGEWMWPDLNKRGEIKDIRNVDYEGISITPGSREESPPGREIGTGYLTYRVGCYYGSNLGEAPPSNVEECNDGPPITVLSFDSVPVEEVWSPEHGFTAKAAPTTVATTLSVEAAIVTEVRGRHRRRGPRGGELLGPENEGEPGRTRACEGDPVDCATGNLTETQTDLNVPGRGVALNLTRTYNSLAAVRAETPGPFGYGWSWNFGAHLSTSDTYPEGVYAKVQTVEQGNGSTTVFTNGAPAPGVLATLGVGGGGYPLYTLPDQTALHFGSGGHLTGETDRNGNQTTVAEPCEGGEEGGGGVAEVRMRYADYTSGFRRDDVSGGDERSCRIEVTDRAGRKMTLYEDAEGLVQRAVDPMGHTVSYGYEEGELTSVTYPGESTPRWRFHYDSRHRLTELIDGRGHVTTNAYDSADRVIEQTGRSGDAKHFEYTANEGEYLEGVAAVGESSEEEELPELTEEEEGFLAAGEAPTPPEQTTTITDESSGAVTVEHFDSENELKSITRGYGTAEASAESLQYDSSGAPTSVTDGNGHSTEYTYDSSGNRTSQKDPDGDETKWEYDGKHDVVGTTNSNGEHTTIERDSHGNALKVSRPAPDGTQTTEYAYDSYGELTSMTDPLEHVWEYEYDGNGDRIAELDPKGDKRTFAFNPDSQEISSTSPRGNASGADPGKYTTIIERDAQGRVVRVIEPLE
jgi:YD repeat-containing protein